MLRRDHLTHSTPLTTPQNSLSSPQAQPPPNHFQRLFRFLDTLKPPAASTTTGMMSWKVEGEEWVKKDDKVTR